MEWRAFAAGVGFLVALVSPALAEAAVTNGDFEGGSYTDGDDAVPNGWTKFETVPTAEISTISLAADNGPSAAGSSAVHFHRYNGGVSVDWTVIRQDVDITTGDYDTLALALDIKVIWHNQMVSATTLAFPVTVIIAYEDADGNAKEARIGWYVNRSASYDGSQDNAWRLSQYIGWLNTRQVPEDEWVTDTVDLLDPALGIAHISRITVGGLGWMYDSRIDNVAIGEPDEPMPVAALVDLAPDTLNLRAKAKWIAAYVMLPDGYDAGDVDLNSVALEGTIAAESGMVEDGVLVVVFSREAVVALIESMGLSLPADIELAVTGIVGDEVFVGSDMVRVIRPGRPR